MRNATATKQKILIESANLFNTQGYKATSISDITKATGLTKGAIYRHFESKQDLEQQALRELSKLMFQEIRMAIRKAPTFEQKFEAIFSFFEKKMIERKKSNQKLEIFSNIKVEAKFARGSNGSTLSL